MAKDQAVDQVLQESLAAPPGKLDYEELTLKQLLQNPTGKASSFMASRQRIIEDLERRFAALLNKHKAIQTQVFKKDRKNYFFLLKVPSENVPSVYYDVCIEFKGNEKDCEKDMTLNRYNVYLFSNAPNFTFTYTYVLNKNKLLSKTFMRKCSEIALKEAPKIKNPVESYGFEKSCYFAALYLAEVGFLTRSVTESNAKVFNEGAMLKAVSSQQEKILEYNGAKKSKTSSAKKAAPKKAKRK